MTVFSSQHIDADHLIMYCLCDPELIQSQTSYRIFPRGLCTVPVHALSSKLYHIKKFGRGPPAT